MWNERRMTSGPRQTKADAASCPLMRSARIGPVPGAHSREHRRARGPPGILRTPSGHHLHSGADVIRHQNVSKSPDQDERAVDEQRLNEPKPVAPRPNEGGTRPELRIVEEHSSQRPILWSGLRPRTGGGTPRAIARIEVRAIGSAMWLVRCCCRRGLLKDPGAGAGGVATITVAGARAGELAAGSTIEPGERLKGLGTHPSPSATRNESGPAADLGQWRLCTGVCTIVLRRRRGSWGRHPARPTSSLTVCSIDANDTRLYRYDKEGTPMSCTDIADWLLRRRVAVLDVRSQAWTTARAELLPSGYTTATCLQRPVASDDSSAVSMSSSTPCARLRRSPSQAGSSPRLITT